jgi:hypothetical protein
MIRIKSKREGFRRCGMAHPGHFAEYPDDRFSPEQIAILKAEPMLIVEVVDQKAAGSAPTAQKEEALEAKSSERPDNAETGIQEGPEGMPAADGGKQPARSRKKGK